MSKEERRKTKGTAYLFPGQGSQWVGMGRDMYRSFPSAKMVFDRADEVLNFPLSRLCFDGPETELRRTINAQPAILTTSLACLSAAQEVGVEEQLGQPLFVAGHSLGEYTSLIASGAADFSDVLRLVRERGRLMEEASQYSQGGMLALLGIDIAAVEEICRSTGTQIANINCPGQVIISGDKGALEKARELAKQRGGKTVPLDVSGAFHSSFMRRARHGLKKILAILRFHRPSIPIVANTTAQPLTGIRAVRAELSSQLCRCVQWQNSVEFMADNGVTTFVEIGPGQVLSGLVHRIKPEVETLSLKDVPSIEGLSRRD